MRLYLYNTARRVKEGFAPADPKRVTVYVCGPTVYAPPHIGNGRAALVFDVLVRLLRHIYGAEHVVYARNMTDIDDRIIKAAREEGVSAEEIAERYAKIYHDDMKRLGVAPPDFEPKATQTISEMQEMIAGLIASGHAYEAEGHVLFSVSSFGSYGRLSGRDKKAMMAGARVEVAPYKRDPSDFVLWKPSGDDEPGWESAWGRGRPGWHMECSAMIRSVLGETIDLHGGGQDLIFPHHENERAQSVSAHGAELARFWVHNAFVRMGREKMSKSEGNVLLVSEIPKGWRGETIRYAMLSAHYRQPLDWTGQTLEEANHALNGLYRHLRDFGEDAPASEPPSEFMEALLDDMNVPKALGVLHGLSREKSAAAASALRSGGAILGLFQEEPRAWLGENSQDKAPPSEEIEALLALRDKAREAKNFAKADQIRDELAAKGFRIEDRGDGTRLYEATTDER